MPRGNHQNSSLHAPSEFNYYRADNGSCVLHPGTQPRSDDDSCYNDEDYWYERTAYRKIPYSSCEGGKRIDRGTAHICPGIKAHGTFFWLMMFFIPCAFAALAGWWYVRKRARGYVSPVVMLRIELIPFTGPFDYPEEMLDPGTEASRAFWRQSHPCRTMCSPWPALCGRRSWRGSRMRPQICEHAVGIGRYPLTRTRRS